MFIAAQRFGSFRLFSGDSPPGRLPRTPNRTVRFGSARLRCKLAELGLLIPLRWVAELHVTVGSRCSSGSLSGSSSGRKSQTSEPPCYHSVHRGFYFTVRMDRIGLAHRVQQPATVPGHSQSVSQLRADRPEPSSVSRNFPGTRHVVRSRHLRWTDRRASAFAESFRVRRRSANHERNLLLVEQRLVDLFLFFPRETNYDRSWREIVQL